jgi:vacuolar protein 8
VEDYQPFISVWDAPSGGLHGYLSRFLESVDTTFQHIAIWTIVQFLEGRDSELIDLITRSPEIIPAVRQLTQGLDSTSPHQQADGDNMMNDESEIVGLAKRVIHMLSQTEKDY